AEQDYRRNPRRESAVAGDPRWMHQQAAARVHGRADDSAWQHPAIDGSVLRSDGGVYHFRSDLRCHSVPDRDALALRHVLSRSPRTVTARLSTLGSGLNVFNRKRFATSEIVEFLVKVLKVTVLTFLLLTGCRVGPNY